MQRAAAEMAKAEILAGAQQGIVDRGLVAGLEIDLVAELARERDPRHQGRRRGDRHAPDREEAERLVRHVLGGEPRQQLARRAARRSRSRPDAP